jgi:signal transduction histidine kinase
MARQAGVAAQAAQLTAELQRSRERLVTAREEERRRLRRDLHDGLGPLLAGVVLQLGTAKNLLIQDPDAVSGLLDTLCAQTQDAIAGIRRIAYDLRPPALDNLGLIGALYEQAARFTNQAGGHPAAESLAVTINAPQSLPALPAAVEVAAYRIMIEALTNVARHAHAHHASVTVAIDGDLCLDVQDDGTPSTANGNRWRPGVGLVSMAERAAEVGGTLQAGPTPTGGRVQASLPLELT